MNRQHLAIVLVALVVFVGAGCEADRGIVWPDGATIGARIIPCPVADCSILFTAAARRLDATDPDHPPVVGARLGTEVCSRDGRAMCTISPPIGGGDRYQVALDLEGGRSILVFVQCWMGPAPNGVPWNGQWCTALG